MPAAEPDPGPRPSREVGAAGWLAPRLRRFGEAVASVVPDGFPAYAAVPHPDREAGNLAPGLLAALCATLAGHTGTAERCWFCLWDGYGWLHGSPAVMLLGPGGGVPVPPAFPPEVLDGPRVRLPGRDYLLFTGPLAAAAGLGWHAPDGGFWPQSPNLFWPDDRAWCVASEIDLACTLVAGPGALADALVADPRLAARRVGPGDPFGPTCDPAGP